MAENTAVPLDRWAQSVSGAAEHLDGLISRISHDLELRFERRLLREVSEALKELASEIANFDTNLTSDRPNWVRRKKEALALTFALTKGIVQGIGAYYGYEDVAPIIAQLVAARAVTDGVNEDLVRTVPGTGEANFGPSVGKPVVSVEGPETQEVEVPTITPPGPTAAFQIGAETVEVTGTADPETGEVDVSVSPDEFEPGAEAVEQTEHAPRDAADDQQGDEFDSRGVDQEPPNPFRVGESEIGGPDVIG